MTLKVEVTKIPNTNSNLVFSCDEFNLNGEIKQQNPRNFVVPDDKTDEFVKKYKKIEKVSFTTGMLTGLAGFFGLGALSLKASKKVYFIDFPIYAALGGFILGIMAPYAIAQNKEKQLLQQFNASEIKTQK